MTYQIRVIMWVSEGLRRAPEGLLLLRELNVSGLLLKSLVLLTLTHSKTTHVVTHVVTTVSLSNS